MNKTIFNFGKSEIRYADSPCIQLGMIGSRIKKYKIPLIYKIEPKIVNCLIFCSVFSVVFFSCIQYAAPLLNVFIANLLMVILTLAEYVLYNLRYCQTFNIIDANFKALFTLAPICIVFPYLLVMNIFSITFASLIVIIITSLLNLVVGAILYYFIDKFYT